MSAPFVSLLTDFGLETAPAVCRGVIQVICPDARISDLTHSVRKFAVRDGAFLLWSAVPYLPVGVHVAVVDPGVGTTRRSIAIQARRGDYFVGPDNGLLIPAAERLGGIGDVREATNPDLHLSNVSSTFHARDIFSPVGAHLAAGVPFGDVGAVLDRTALVRLPWPQAEERDGGLDTGVLFVDSFGNCRLAGSTEDFSNALGPLVAGRRLRIIAEGATTIVPWAPSFGHVGPGEAMLYPDADYDGPGLAVNQGSAARRFGLELDTSIRIEPA